MNAYGKNIFFLYYLLSTGRTTTITRTTATTTRGVATVYNNLSNCVLHYLIYLPFSGSFVVFASRAWMTSWTTIGRVTTRRTSGARTTINRITTWRRAWRAAVILGWSASWTTFIRRSASWTTVYFLTIQRSVIIVVLQKDRLKTCRTSQLCLYLPWDLRVYLSLPSFFFFFSKEI